jgi:hypothetical protein
VQVSGAGFAALIATAGYNLAAGYAAAKRRDIATHQRCMVRMVGGAYGVFPFKQIFVVLSSFVLPGHWAYAAGVWLSWPIGAMLCKSMYVCTFICNFVSHAHATLDSSSRMFAIWV